jgi:hypothetical protein
MAHLRALLQTLEAPEVRIWDPYFCPKDVLDFLGWVHPDTSIRILCGSTSNNLNGVSRSTADIRLSLASLIAGPPPRKIVGKFRVSKPVRAGGRFLTIYHDRFIITDQAAWLLGSSLNSIGTKPGVVLQLIDPLRLRQLFDEEWNANLPPAQFVDNAL